MVPSPLLLALYGAAREHPPGSFEKRAFALLRGPLSFDSAIWGLGLLRKDGSVAPHHVNLNEQPWEAVEEWAQLNVADPVANAVMTQPGVPIRFHAPTLFGAKTSSAMREYAKRHGRQSYMVCGMRHAVQPDFFGWISFYRRDPEAHFSETEQKFCQELVQHLQEAQRVNQAVHLHSASLALDQADVVGIADEWGYLHTPWKELRELLQREWPCAIPGRLPEALLDSLAKSPEGRWHGRAISVRSRMFNGLLYLRVRARTERSCLSEREEQIAELIARGGSSKEIGKWLDLSPETVRVHLRNTYRKLGVHSQAELGHWVARRDK